MAMIGILTGCIASVIDIAVKYTSDLKFSYIKHCILILLYPKKGCYGCYLNLLSILSFVGHVEQGCHGQGKTSGK